MSEYEKRVILLFINDMRIYMIYLSHIVKKNGFYIGSLLLLFSCARVVSPTGGPKDEISPLLVKSNPISGTVNFSGRTIRLQFNEIITTKNLQSQFIISPYTKNPYTFKVRGNMLTLIFEQDFQKNTTYSLYFRESIIDITEENSAKDLAIIFSTGNTLDSLSIQGEVRDLKTNQLVENANVILYDTSDTFDINKGNPFYFIKTDKEGNYHFQNIKRGNYKLYALLEEDKNFRYTKRHEKIAFLDTFLTLDTSIVSLNLKVNDYDIKPFRFLDARTEKQNVSINFNKPFYTYQISYTDTTWKNRIFHKQEKESIILYCTETTKTDSIELSIEAIDSIGQTSLEILKVQFTESKEKKTKERFTARIIPKKGVKWKPKEKRNIFIQFNKPVKIYQKDSVYFIDETDTTQFEQNLDVNFNKTLWNTSLSIQNENRFSLLFLRGSFISVEDDTLSQFAISYDVKSEKDCGTIKGKILTNDTSAFIVQLLDEEYQLIEELHGNTYEFNYISPGTVYLRAIEDKNKNDKWDMGDFMERIGSESVHFFPEKIVVKANWELLDVNIEKDQVSNTVN